MLHTNPNSIFASLSCCCMHAFDVVGIICSKFISRLRTALADETYGSARHKRGAASNGKLFLFGKLNSRK